jgi:hypothetical protein
MTSGTTAPVAFQDVLASMAEVDRLKSREELLAAEADLPARVADVTARLKDVYARQGVAVADDVIARGVEQFFSQRLVFQPPAPSFATRMAGAWIQRRRIVRAAMAVGAVATVVAAGVYFGAVVPAREARARAIGGARQAIADAQERVQATQRTGATVFAHAAQEITGVKVKAGDEELARAAGVAESQAAESQLAFEQKIRAADEMLTSAAASPVTAENAPRLVRLAHDATQLEGASRVEIDRATGVSHHLAELQRERALLGGAWRRLDHPGLSRPLHALGEQAYARGLAVVTAFGPATEVHAAAARLQTLADTEAQLNALPARIKAAANEARAASNDAHANALIAQAERSGLAAAESANTRGAESSLGTLRDITAQLEATYVLRIVNRRREYTRLWRYPNDHPGVKNFYVVVEAVGPDGRLVPTRIRSEEDNSVATVSKWAERVDEATYEAVGRDKADDGVVQNNTFAEKTKGQLAPTYRMGAKARGEDVEAGRIYRWEYRG